MKVADAVWEIAIPTNFISHMVQMKGFAFFSLCSSKHIFISHMVQMKVSETVKAYNQKQRFISHMVQMKEKYIK